jgi:hypothetical protein
VVIICEWPRVKVNINNVVSRGMLLLVMLVDLILLEKFIFMGYVSNGLWFICSVRFLNLAITTFHHLG